MAECSKCGQQLPPEGKFCPGCGTPRPEPPPPASQPAPSVPSASPPPPSSPAAGGALPDLNSIVAWLTGIFRSLSRWDAAALGGGVIGAGVWYGWSTLDVKDTVTPKYIMLMPILIVLFRKPLDVLLRPLQVVKQRIPRLVLIAAGLAAPYLVAHTLYDRVSPYGKEWAYAQKSIIWGTV